MPDKYDVAPEGGLCKGKSTELWFPLHRKGGVSAEERAKRKADEDFVRKTCSECSVTVHCLEYSLRHEPFGTWGGKTETERSEIRNARGIFMSVRDVNA